jgi:indolepyruvate ferredoxin oxidoreductase beta subunit
MKLRTTTVLGYLRVWLLAKLKPIRRGTWRYQTEQVQIESWLSHIRFAAETGDVDLAREITELARLIKGYGDTHRRGLANYASISRAILGRALDAGTPPRATAALIKAAREAALADPDGKALEGLLAQSTPAPGAPVA